jgi:hypothetical protein
VQIPLFAIVLQASMSMLGKTLLSIFSVFVATIQKYYLLITQKLLIFIVHHQIFTVQGE